MSGRLSCVLGWMLAWALCGGSATALAQGKSPPVYPDPPGQGPELVYVGPQGLGRERVTLADVKARWGSPEVVRNAPHDPRAALHWQYPSKGLRFQVNWENRDDKNPLVGWLQLDLPFDGRTPQGLYLGMPQAEAMAIVQRYYRVRSRLDLTSQSASQPKGQSVSVGNHGWRHSQLANFEFRQGRLFSMGFQLKPRPWIDPGLVRRTQGLLVLAAVALAASWVYLRLKHGMGAWWWRVQCLLAALLMAGGAWWLVAAQGMLGGGDGYSRMAGLVLGLCGAGALVVGLGMLVMAVRARSDEPSRRTSGASRGHANPSPRPPPEA